MEMFTVMCREVVLGTRLCRNGLGLDWRFLIWLTELAGWS